MPKVEYDLVKHNLLKRTDYIYRNKRITRYAKNKNRRMRYAHIEYTGRAGHPAGVFADAVCVGVGYTADIVRLVCGSVCM